jgi:hypothetical protein
MSLEATVKVTLEQAARSPRGYDFTLAAIALADKLFGSSREPVPQPKVEDEKYVLDIAGQTKVPKRKLRSFVRDETKYWPRTRVEAVYQSSRPVIFYTR